MAITDCWLTSSKIGFLSGAFRDTDTYAVALMTSTLTGTYDETFSGQYLPTRIEECPTAAGYTISGTTVTPSYAVTTGTGSLDFSSPVWNLTGAPGVAAAGICLYKSGTRDILGFWNLNPNPSILTSGTFTVQIPAAGVGLFRI